MNAIKIVTELAEEGATTTDMIVELADAGLTVVEIRDTLNIRYQQVRNTLLRKDFVLTEKAINYEQPWEFIDAQSGIPQYAN